MVQPTGNEWYNIIYNMHTIILLMSRASTQILLSPNNEVETMHCIDTFAKQLRWMMVFNPSPYLTFHPAMVCTEEVNY